MKYLIIAIIILIIWRHLAKRNRCPRERTGYRCHKDRPGGCEACGRAEVSL